MRTLGTQPQASWSLRTDKVTSVTPSYHLPSASLRVVLSCITDPVATPPPSCPAPNLAFQSIFLKHFGELRLFRVSSQGLTINLSLLQAPRFQLSGLTVPRAQELVLSLWIFPSFHPDYITCFSSLPLLSTSSPCRFDLSWDGWRMEMLLSGRETEGRGESAKSGNFLRFLPSSS